MIATSDRWEGLEFVANDHVRIELDIYGILAAQLREVLSTISALNKFSGMQLESLLAFDRMPYVYGQSVETELFELYGPDEREKLMSNMVGIALSLANARPKLIEHEEVFKRFTAFPDEGKLLSDFDAVDIASLVVLDRAVELNLGSMKIGDSSAQVFEDWQSDEESKVRILQEQNDWDGLDAEPTVIPALRGVLYPMRTKGPSLSDDVVLLLETWVKTDDGVRNVKESFVTVDTTSMSLRPRLVSLARSVEFISEQPFGMRLD